LLGSKVFFFARLELCWWFVFLGKGKDVLTVHCSTVEIDAIDALGSMVLNYKGNCVIQQVLNYEGNANPT
jgi:hypothetical protein